MLQANITRLLLDYKAGDKSVLDELFPFVYDELRRLAANRLREERGDHTLQATALVHEAYLRLIEQHSVDWRDRAHFFGIASEMMRRILVNHAVSRKADKRGSGATKISLDDAVTFAETREIDLGELDEALNRLADFAPRQAKIVEMRFFGGLTIEETAESIGVSDKTVKRDWRVARAWLSERLKS